MNLKYPDRPPECKEMCSGTYRHDHEYVKQDDGSLAYFIWSAYISPPDNPEWQFIGFKDKYDMLLSDEEYPDIEGDQFLLDNIVHPDNLHKCTWLDDYDNLKEMKEY